MNSKKIGMATLLALAVAAPSAEAAVRLKVSQGFGGSAEQEYSEGFSGTQDGDYAPTALSAAYIGPQGGFVDFSYSTSDDDTEWQNFSGYGYERTDWALVGGVSKNNLAFYAGWRSGEGLTTYPGGGEDTLSSQGVVVGMSGNIKPAPKHTITPSIGMGFLAGEWEQPGSNSLVEFDWTFGFSYGLAYSYQATQNIAVGLEFKGQMYTFEWVEDGTSSFGADLTVDESLQSTGAFVSFVF